MKSGRDFGPGEKSATSGKLEGASLKTLDVKAQEPGLQPPRIVVRKEANPRAILAEMATNPRANLYIV